MFYMMNNIKGNNTLQLSNLAEMTYYNNIVKSIYDSFSGVRSMR